MKNHRRKSKKVRTSAYEHLWPEMAYMPELNHWPDRPEPFCPERSQVLAYIIEGYGGDLREAERIMRAARHAGAICYNPNTKVWFGQKGGQP
jgi:hypothetical protein